MLCDTLDIPAGEVARMLETTSAAVNSSLQRARSTLARASGDMDRPIEPAPAQRHVVEQWIAAFVAGDVEALTRLLTDAVVLEMPPMRNWYQGAAHYGAFMNRIYRTRGSSWRSVLVEANAQMGCASYLCHDDGDYVLHTVQLFEIVGVRISRVSVFQDPDVFALFDLPARWVEPSAS